MSEVIAFSESPKPVRLNVVFIHGLAGGGLETWQRDDNQSLPTWIADDDDEIGVYSVDYDASPLKWLGSGMPLIDRANELIETLRLNDVFKVPTVFVAHSMGGIIVKKMIQLAATQKLPEWAYIEDSIRGVVFLSTPHAGAGMANFLKQLSKALPIRPTEAALELERNSAQLRDLSSWFRNNVEKSNIRSRVYFEKRDTLGVRVVDESSADPGLSSVVVTPVDANHFEIAAPGHNTLVHLGVRDFVRDIARKVPRVHVPRRSLQEAKAALDPEKQAIVSSLDGSPHLQSWAIEVLSAPQYPIMMSLCNGGHLVPNPAWQTPGLDDAAKSLPLTNCLRGHMFLSVVHPPGNHPHLKCYFAERWGANLVPFFKHPREREDYLEAVQEHARDHYEAEIHPTGKAVISVKRNEQYKGELWLYCFEFFNLVLPHNYRSSEDHRWLNLERLSDENYPEAHVNGDIIRALREHFGTGFHGVMQSRIDSAELKLGDS